MKNGFSRLLLPWVLILSLSACGDEGAASVPSFTVREIAEGGQPAAVTWQGSHASLDSRLEAAVIQDDSVYGYYLDGAGLTVAAWDIQSGSILREAKIPDVTEARSLTADPNGNVYVLGTSLGRDAFWQIDSEGQVTVMGDFVLEDLDDRFQAIPKGLFVDEQGYFYIWYETTVPVSVFFEGEDADVYTLTDRIYVKDSQLNTLFYEQVPNSKGIRLLSFSFGSDGTPALLVRDTDGIYMQELRSGDEADKVRMDETGLSGACENVILTEDGFLFCQESGLYQYLFEGQKTEKLLDLSSYGIFPSDILYLGVKGDAIEIVDNYGASSNSEYTLLEIGESSKIRLSLGAIQATQDLKNAVTQFNRFCDNIQIEIVDYYDGQKSFDAGAEQLTLDIIRGQAPDILEMSVIDYDIFAGKGILADLYDYMEQDSECKRELLMPEVLAAFETDGHLYSVAPAFQLYSMWGNRSTTGGQYGITLTELMEVLGNNGRDINAIYGFSADEPVLTTLCAMGMDEFIDWENGSCDFEGEGFQAVLNFAKEYTGGYVEGSLSEGIQNGNILMTVGMIDDVADYQLQSQLYGGDVNFIGYPSAGGTGTAVGFRGSQLAINAKGQNGEAAWEFVKYYLLNGYEDNGFPLVKEQFDEAMEQAMEVKYLPDTGGEYRMTMEVYQDAGTYIEIYEATQADVDAVKQLIGRADTRFAYHTEIQNIINEEAGSYFTGQKDLQEAAALIQNRVQLYLQEQMTE